MQAIEPGPEQRDADNSADVDISTTACRDNDSSVMQTNEAGVEPVQVPAKPKPKPTRSRRRTTGNSSDVAVPTPTTATGLGDNSGAMLALEPGVEPALVLAKRNPTRSKGRTAGNSTLVAMLTPTTATGLGDNSGVMLALEAGVEPALVPAKPKRTRPKRRTASNTAHMGMLAPTTATGLRDNSGVMLALEAGVEPAIVPAKPKRTRPKRHTAGNTAESTMLAPTTATGLSDSGDVVQALELSVKSATLPTKRKSTRAKRRTAGNTAESAMLAPTTATGLRDGGDVVQALESGVIPASEPTNRKSTRAKRRTAGNSAAVSILTQTGATGSRDGGGVLQAMDAGVVPASNPTKRKPTRAKQRTAGKSAAVSILTQTGAAGLRDGGGVLQTMDAGVVPASKPSKCSRARRGKRPSSALENDSSETIPTGYRGNFTRLNVGENITANPSKKRRVAVKASRNSKAAKTSEQRVISQRALLSRLGEVTPVCTGATNLELLEAISVLLSSDEDSAAESEESVNADNDLTTGDFDEEQMQREEAHAQEEDRVRHRAAVLATHSDVNVCLEENERDDYEVLASDCPSELDEGSESEDDDLPYVNYNADWSDEAVATYMETLGDDINDDDALLTLAKNKKEIKAWEETGWEEVSGSIEPQPEYRGIYKGEWGPTPAVLRHAESPLDIFWFFFPKRLLGVIADESNRYAAQTVVTRARKIREQQIASRQRGSRAKEVESLAQIRQRLRQMRLFQPHEYAVTFGLLIARMLCPQKRRLSTHWSTSSVGALPGGTFGQWMPRNRFDEIMRHLHFSDNLSERAKFDRAWKIRPIVDSLQATFSSGYKPGGVLSFDEGMLPSHSKYNGTRMYMRDKPHKWGTKMFLTCCPKTSYCLRLEIYCGKKAHLGGPQTIDDKSGPAAVLRNLDMVLPKDRQSHHVVVVDRFYTSVALALELLASKIYIVGTIQQRRIGFPAALKEKRKKRPSDIPRGSYKVARSKAVPEMSACCWWDSKPVHLLSTGASLQELTIGRNTWVEGEPSEIPCPKLVRDYHQSMGGVDVHDQLRLQRYSVQLAFTFKKYYKALFLGLLDLALVNAFIVHRTYFSRMGKKGMSHSAFLTMLHAQLLAVKSSDMEERHDPTPFQQPLARRYINLSDHVPTETQDFHGEVGDPDRKRMHRACKVCSVLAPPGKRGKNTKWLCEACSQGRTGDVYLCQLMRHESFGIKKSCFSIWHEDWDCGKRLPVHVDKRIQYRRPTGKKRQHQTGQTNVPTIGNST